MTPRRAPVATGWLHIAVRLAVLALVLMTSAGCGLLLGLDEDATLIDGLPPGQDPSCAEICDDGDRCTYDRCVQGTTECVHDAVPDGPAPDTSQVPGDCRAVLCSAGVASEVVDADDRPGDELCAAGACVDGEPQLQPYEREVVCAGGYCDGDGSCNECLSNDHCDWPDTCGGGVEPDTCGCTPHSCADLGLTCGSASDGCHALLNCDDGLVSGDETDVDCGGSLDGCKTRCALSRDCAFGTDCASGHCGGGSCTAPWSKVYGDDVTQHAHAIATDGDHDIILTGEFAGKIRFGTTDLVAPAGQVHAYLAKLDAEGGHIWSHAYGASGSVDIRDVASDGAGNVVAVGWFQGALTIETTTLVSGPNEQAFVFKLDDQGFLLWARQVTSPASGGSSRALAVAIDATNRPWVGGDASGNIEIDGDALSSFDGTDAMLLGLTAGGTVHFAELYGAAGVQRVTSVAANLSGDLAIAGDFTGDMVLPPNPPTASKGNFDAFAARLDSSGTPMWWRTFGSANEQHATSVSFDIHGNVVVGGNFFGQLDDGIALYPSMGGEDLFVMQLRAMTGDTYWTSVHGDVAADHLAAVAADVNGDVTFTGYFSGTLAMGGSTLTSAGGNDVFVAKLDNSGGVHWARRYGDGDAQNGVDLAVTPTGTLCLTGDFQGSIDFGQGLFASAGADDVFVASLGPWP